MAAYQSLGPFISTFADPHNSGFFVDEHGRLCKFNIPVKTEGESSADQGDEKKYVVCVIRHWWRWDNFYDFRWRRNFRKPAVFGRVKLEALFTYNCMRRKLKSYCWNYAVFILCVNMANFFFMILLYEVQWWKKYFTFWERKRTLKSFCK